MITREFRYTQCIQCDRTTKLSATLVRDAICQQKCASQADKQRLQHTKVAGCDNKHTAHSAAHKRRQQFDDNLVTTYQLDAYLPHCSICCQPQGVKQHAQKTCAHQHQAINPTCPITIVPTRGSQQELRHILLVTQLP